jgi:hypothetical protein
MQEQLLSKATCLVIFTLTGQKYEACQQQQWHNAAKITRTKHHKVKNRAS